MKVLLYSKVPAVAAIFALTLFSKTSLAQDFVRQFPLHTKTKYFEFHYKRNSSYVTQIARVSDGFIRLVNRDFFKADFDYPVRVFVLEDESRLEKFVNQELQIPGPAGFGIYAYSYRVLATYEGSGLGTFGHEVMRNFDSLCSCPEIILLRSS